MKYLIIMLFCLPLITGEDLRSMQLEHKDIVQHEDATLLSGEHFFITYISNEKENIVSAYTTPDTISVYDGENHSICQVVMKKSNIIFHVKHRSKLKLSLAYVIKYNIAGKLNVEFVGEHKAKLLPFIFQATSLYIVENTQDITSHLLQAANALNSIAQKAFPQDTKDLNGRVKKIKRQWRMEKKSGDNSIYLSVKNLKIIDYSAYITGKSQNIKLANIRSILISENVLKISVGQMTYYGKGYWLEGGATLICQ